MKIGDCVDEDEEGEGSGKNFKSNKVFVLNEKLIIHTVSNI